MWPSSRPPSRPRTRELPWSLVAFAAGFVTVVAFAVVALAAGFVAVVAVAFVAFAAGFVAVVAVAFAGAPLERGGSLVE